MTDEITDEQLFHADYIRAKKAFLPIKHSGRNSRFNTTFANYGDIMDAIEGALMDNHITIHHHTEYDTSDGYRLTTTLKHLGKIQDATSMKVPYGGTDIQRTEGNGTYTKRYNIIRLCSLSVGDREDDGNSNTPEPVKPTTVPPVLFNANDDNQVMKFVSFMHEKKIDPNLHRLMIDWLDNKPTSEWKNSYWEAKNRYEEGK